MLLADRVLIKKNKELRAKRRLCCIHGMELIGKLSAVLSVVEEMFLIGWNKDLIDFYKKLKLKMVHKYYNAKLMFKSKKRWSHT